MLSCRKKKDAASIQQFLKKLAEEDWLRRTERRWWPKFVFHYTDIRNAVQVLQDGFLYCRSHVEEVGKLSVSSGSPKILAITDARIKDAVRLDFRPKTPT